APAALPPPRSAAQSSARSRGTRRSRGPSGRGTSSRPLPASELLEKLLREQPVDLHAHDREREDLTVRVEQRDAAAPRLALHPDRLVPGEIEEHRGLAADQVRRRVAA